MSREIEGGCTTSKIYPERGTSGEFKYQNGLVMAYVIRKYHRAKLRWRDVVPIDNERDNERK